MNRIGSKFVEKNILIPRFANQLKAHYYRHKIDARIEVPVNDNRDIPEKLWSIPMSNKKIEAWKFQAAKGKSIFVATPDGKNMQHPASSY
jgi:hypothetical protein